MRNLDRNKRVLKFSLYEGNSNIPDDYGNLLPKYSETKTLKASISATKGNTENELFGTMIDYDRVIITDDISCPIDEQTILFIDVEPKYDDYNQPIGDYVVKRVARSLNNISYAISKVNVS